MSTPAIDNRALRYATSFTVILGAISLSTAAAVAVPDSVPYHETVEMTVITAGALAGLELFWRIEEGGSPVRQWLNGFDG